MPYPLVLTCSSIKSYFPSLHDICIEDTEKIFIYCHFYEKFSAEHVLFETFCFVSVTVFKILVNSKLPQDSTQEVQSENLIM